MEHDIIIIRGDFLLKIISVTNRKGNRFDNLTGKRFGRLTVVGLSPKKSGRKSYWVCKCDCGNEIVVRSDALKCGNTKSCGCLKQEQDKINLSKNHKGYNTPNRLYGIWVQMKDRCLNTNNENYFRYGERGIKIYPAWVHDYGNFRDWAFDHGYNKHLTIDRIDNNGDYEPTNCRWVTMKTQSNNRSSNHNVAWNGETHTLKEWSEIYSINYETLRDRFHRGDLPPRLFETTAQRKKDLKKAIYIEWRGKRLSLKQWSKRLGINYATLKGRYKRGKRCPELFKPVQNHNKKIPR